MLLGYRSYWRYRATRVTGLLVPLQIPGSWATGDTDFGATGATGITGATGASGPTDTHFYAGNTTCPYNHYLLLVVRTLLYQVIKILMVYLNGSNDTFTVQQTGKYYITYQVNTTAALFSEHKAMVEWINCYSRFQFSRPAVSTTFMSNTVIVNLTAGNTISLLIFGAVCNSHSNRWWCNRCITYHHQTS